MKSLPNVYLNEKSGCNILEQNQFGAILLSPDCKEIHAPRDAVI